MTANEWAGVGMVVLVFAVLIGGTIVAAGWRVALGVWAFSFAMTAVLALGIGLATDFH